MARLEFLEQLLAEHESTPANGLGLEAVMPMVVVGLNSSNADTRNKGIEVRFWSGYGLSWYVGSYFFYRFLFWGRGLVVMWGVVLWVRMCLRERVACCAVLCAVCGAGIGYALVRYAMCTALHVCYHARY